MEISDTLLCLYSGSLTERDGSYVIEVPESEIANESIESGSVYPVALFSRGSVEGDDNGPDPRHEQQASGPPVTEGDQRTVDIEDIGEQGDGIARVERGYVLIVPDTEKGERLTIEITNVRENLGFATVIEREEYYE